MLVLAVSEDLYKLFEDSILTSLTSLGELCRVVIMAVDFAFVFVVAVLGSKYRWTDRACKMLNMILSFQRCDV